MNDAARLQSQMTHLHKIEDWRIEIYERINGPFTPPPNTQQENEFKFIHRENFKAVGITSAKRATHNILACVSKDESKKMLFDKWIEHNTQYTHPVDWYWSLNFRKQNLLKREFHQYRVTLKIGEGFEFEIDPESEPYDQTKIRDKIYQSINFWIQKENILRSVYVVEAKDGKAQVTDVHLKCYESKLMDGHLYEIWLETRAAQVVAKVYAPSEDGPVLLHSYYHDIGKDLALNIHRHHEGYYFQSVTKMDKIPSVRRVT